MAKTCPPPKEIETGKIVGGFAHNQVLALADDLGRTEYADYLRRIVHEKETGFCNCSRRRPPGSSSSTSSPPSFSVR